MFRPPPSRLFGLFENLVDPFAADDPAMDPPRRLLPFIWFYIRPFRRVFLVTAALSVVVALGDLALIWYVGRVIDLLAATTPAALWRDHGLEFLLVALAIVVLRPLVVAAQVGLLHNTILPSSGAMIRWRAHRHVLRQPLHWFENDFAGRLANRIMQTPTSIADAIFQVFDAAAFAVTTALGAVVMMANADARLALPLLIWLAAYGALVRWTVRRAGPAAQASADARSAITARVVDAYTNIQSVKLFAHDDREARHFRNVVDTARGRVQAEMRIVTRMDLLLTLLNGALIVAVIGWAVALWQQGQASAGLVAAAAALVLRLNNMTYWIMWSMTTLVQSLGVVAEGMQTIAQPLLQQDRPQAPDLRPGPGAIRLQGVSHHYGRGQGGLDRLSLDIAPGEKIGLIGRSGAGKSTLVRLILRFHDPESGQICIDGQDIATVTEASLRARMGMVAQDTSLLHRSVRENILYGRPDASDDQMIAAARAAQAHDFILGLSDAEGRQGYDALVGERGVKLSGGQRQRIALARVILKDAPILILDEATSALDSEAEAAIQASLGQVMQGKTVIAIAHRLSTIARMDRILVLEDGRIAEQGSHDALLAQGGLYAGFWARQSGGFIDTEPQP